MIKRPAVTKVRQRGAAALLVVIPLILILIGVVGYFVYTNSKSDLTPETVDEPLKVSKKIPEEPIGEKDLDEVESAIWSYNKETEFDGESLVKFDKSNLDKLTDIKTGTISLWFKFTKSKTKQFLPLLYIGKEKGKGVASNLVIEIGHYDHGSSPDTKLYYTLYDDKQFEPFLCFDSGKNLIENTWYHFAVVSGPGGNTGYLNGVELTQRHYNFGNAKDKRFITDIPIKDDFYLGYGWFGIDQKWHYFEGSIKDIQIFNKTLTSEEITKLAK